jgi:hypothetical protein
MIVCGAAHVLYGDHARRGTGPGAGCGALGYFCDLECDDDQRDGMGVCERVMGWVDV